MHASLHEQVSVCGGLCYRKLLEQHSFKYLLKYMSFFQKKISSVQNHKTEWNVKKKWTTGFDIWPDDEAPHLHMHVMYDPWKLESKKTSSKHFIKTDNLISFFKNDKFKNSGHETYHRAGIQVKYLADAILDFHNIQHSHGFDFKIKHSIPKNIKNRIQNRTKPNLAWIPYTLFNSHTLVNPHTFDNPLKFSNPTIHQIIDHRGQRPYGTFAPQFFPHFVTNYNKPVRHEPVFQFANVNLINELLNKTQQQNYKDFIVILKPKEDASSVVHLLVLPKRYYFNVVELKSNDTSMVEKMRRVGMLVGDEIVKRSTHGYKNLLNPSKNLTPTQIDSLYRALTIGMSSYSDNKNSTVRPQHPIGIPMNGNQRGTKRMRY